MKHLFFILTISLLVFASCGEKKVPQPQREGIQWGEIRFGTLDEFGETEEATLHFTYASGKTDSLPFTLLYDMSPENFELIGGGRIEEQDINFDGIPDVQIGKGAFDGYGNYQFEGYVWNKEKGVFVNVPDFGYIFNPVLSEKAIIGVYREWMEGIEYQNAEKYEWVNGELVKTDEWTDQFDPNAED